MPSPRVTLVVNGRRYRMMRRSDGSFLRVWRSANERLAAQVGDTANQLFITSGGEGYLAARPWPCIIAELSVVHTHDCQAGKWRKGRGYGACNCGGETLLADLVRPAKASARTRRAI